jgi:hypothetical protein
MGGFGANETISALIPVDLVRQGALEGGNIGLKWSSDVAVILSKGKDVKRTLVEGRDEDEDGNKKMRTL